MNLTRSIFTFAATTLVIAGVSGCTTQTRRYAANETRATVAGFSEEDIDDTVARAVQSIYALDRIILCEGANHAVVIVEDVVNDTASRGYDAAVLAESIGQSLREELTNGGKVIVYNREAAQYATVRVAPQYILKGRLTQRNMRQDDGDRQIEYNLNLTLIEIQTGLEFWQKRVHVGKLAAKSNAF